MKMRVVRLFTYALVGLIVLGFSGCSTGQHGRNVEEANKRINTQRANIMLPLAIEQFETGDLDEALRTTSEALRNDPGNAAFHILAGRIAMEQGKLERGLHLLDRAIELNPGLPDAHYYRGIVFQRWQRIDEARQCYQRAYDLESDQPAYLLAVAEMLVASDLADEALQMIESKLIYFEYKPGLNAAVGGLYMMRRDFAKAIEYLYEAHMLEPDDARMLEQLAMAELAAGQANQAVRHLEQLTRDPVNSHRNDLRRTLASAYLRSGRIGDSRDIYKRMTRKDPSDVESWINLGEIAWRGGDIASTLVAANQVMNYAPQRPAGYLLAGLVWQKRNQHDRALTFFEKAYAAAPDNDMVVLLKGIAHQYVGDRQQAFLAFMEAMRRNPNNDRARQLLSHIGATN